MKYTKHLSVALMALGLSAPLLADQGVSVPSQHGGFKMVIDPLYMRKNAVNDISDSNFDWGVYAQVGYLFPCTGNDVTVDYTYLRSESNDALDLDNVGLEVGQRLTTGAFDIRLFTGMRYTHLNYVLNMNGQDRDGQSTFTNLFHGFGPRMGADVRYQLGNGFGLDTHINTALLVGTLSSKLQNQSSSRSASMNRVVPDMDAKLGVDYTYCIPGDSKSAFVVELGYQTANYFNALNSGLIGGSGDAGFDGAYLDVKYYS